MAKVVHLTSAHKPLDTRIFHKECRTLREAGHEVILIAPSTTSKRKEGIQIFGVDPPENRWRRAWKTAREVTRRAREIDADLYHIHDPELLLWSKLFLDGRAPVIYDMHENLVAQIQTKAWIPKPIRPLVSQVSEIGLRLLLPGRPVVFAEMSYEDEYDWLRKTTTVQNMPIVSELTGIEESKFPTPTLGYIGSVRPDRGSIVTLRALKILQKEGYDVAWECIGAATADHEKALSKLERSLGLRNVRMSGYLPPEQGWVRMARCHIGIAMLDKSPNFVGSYPTKLFEYMALGLPVVTSDIPMYQSVVEEANCGLVADPESPESIADAVATLIENPDWARRMGERGREAVRKFFNWKQEGQKLVAFYDSVISQYS